LSRPNNIDKPRQRGHFTRERLPIRPTSWRDNALLLIKGNEAITSEIHDEPIDHRRAKREQVRSLADWQVELT